VLQLWCASNCSAAKPLSEAQSGRPSPFPHHCREGRPELFHQHHAEILHRQRETCCAPRRTRCAEATSSKSRNTEPARNNSRTLWTEKRSAGKRCCARDFTTGTTNSWCLVVFRSEERRVGKEGRS